MATTNIAFNQKHTLLRSTSLVSVMTLMSRLLGFARDMILAYFFGAQAGIDAFYVAFRIPNFMRRLFAEGAFSQAFVPVLSEYQQTRPVEDVRTFIARVFGQLAFVLSIVTVIAVVAAPLILWVFAPGFGSGSTRAVLATEMLRLTFPYLMLISLTAMAGAILNTYGYFGVPAFTPVLLNISMIVATVYWTPYFDAPVVAIAVGVLVAGIAQLVFQIPFLYHRRLLVRPQLSFRDEGVKRVLKLMVPALFGVSVAQLNLMVDSIFASFLKVGSISWLYYTDRLTDFPLGVFGVAIATVILPHLSRRHVDADLVKFSQALDWALRLILLIGVASGVGLVAFSMPLIASCFGYGAFNQYDILQTQKSLMALGLGVPAFMAIKVLASGFYARQDIKTPVKIGVWAMVINSGLCAALIIPLAHAGLALASALAGYVNLGALLVILKRRGWYRPSPGWRLFLLQLTAGNLAVGLYLWLNMHTVSYWLGWEAGMRVSVLLGHVLASIVIYAVVLMLLGLRVKHFRGQAKKEQT